MNLNAKRLWLVPIVMFIGLNQTANADKLWNCDNPNLTKAIIRTFNQHFSIFGEVIKIRNIKQIETITINDVPIARDCKAKLIFSNSTYENIGYECAYVGFNHCVLKYRDFENVPIPD